MISIKQIQERNYNLDFKNPNGKADVVHKSPEELLAEIVKKEGEIFGIIKDIKSSL